MRSRLTGLPATIWPPLPRPWARAWWAALLLGLATLAGLDLLRQIDRHEVDVRILHRLLSQAAAQHDTMLATLALLDEGEPAGSGRGAATLAATQRLPALYPQILAVRRRLADQDWDGAPRKADAVPPEADATASSLAIELAAAEALSRQTGAAALAHAELAQGRYWLVRAGSGASHALHIDLARLWPRPPDWSDGSAGRARLQLGLDAAVDAAPAPPAPRLSRPETTERPYIAQPGRPAGLAESAPLAWPLVLTKPLASRSQPFILRAERRFGLADVAAAPLLAAGLLLLALRLGGASLLRQVQARARAEELLRRGQLAQLGRLGELAAGMAHELNQPLTAVLASSQAAERLLAVNEDDEPDLPLARAALARATAQARRATEVLQRLRRLIERPAVAPGQALSHVDLAAAARECLDLLQAECQRRGVRADLLAEATHPGPIVQADPVALQQVLHNLLMNALQALETLPDGPARRLWLWLPAATAPQPGRASALAELQVIDSGPGIPADALPHLFEPFYTRRASGAGGLGLGLSLAEHLTQAMQGELQAWNRADPPAGAAVPPADLAAAAADNRSRHGAVFCLRLPLAIGTASA
ncbi:MAG: hypothetical protein RL722_2734 [Pseudomonadota bacterium]|jgi:signal transduction histidine kinase